MSPLPSALRWRVLLARIGRRVRAAWPGPRTVYVAERVAEYRAYWSEAARRIGASFTELSPGVWEARRGACRTRLANFVTQCDDPVTLQLAGDKPYGHALAAAAGVPVPEHQVVTLDSLPEARRFLERVGRLVVKPAADSSSALGVTTDVRNRRELAAAMALASLYSDRILLERLVPGESYRLLYLAGRLIHAVRRRGIRVTGDGRRSVLELVRAAGQASLMDDLVTRQTLAAQGLTPGTVPPPGGGVLVRGLPRGSRAKRELRTVYDESVLPLCGPELIREGAEVVRGLGSELAGVDVITTNPAISLRASGGSFIEINTTPGIHHHYITDEDRAKSPVAVAVLEYLLARNRGPVGLGAAGTPEEGSA